MPRLTHRDLREVGEVLRDLYGNLAPEAFAASATRALMRLVPADRGSYNEIHHRLGTTLTVIEPDPGPLPRRLWEGLSRNSNESPVARYYRTTGDGRALKFSDFLSRPAFQRLKLYNEYFRWVGIEHQIAVGLIASPTNVTGFTLSRERRDFSERDRLVLDLLRPHLAQARTNARAFEDIRAQLDLLQTAAEASGLGILGLGPGRRILFATRQGREWLAACFGSRRGRADQLPEEIARWIREREDARGAITAVEHPLVLVRGARRFVIRIVTGAGQRILLVQEAAAPLGAGSLAPLGLTPRETEVLGWVAVGKTNGEIGRILGAREATVAKHLERVYRKLGVETRTAAVAHATAVASLGTPEAR